MVLNWWAQSALIFNLCSLVPTTLCLVGLWLQDIKFDGPWPNGCCRPLFQTKLWLGHVKSVSDLIRRNNVDGVVHECTFDVTEQQSWLNRDISINQKTMWYGTHKSLVVSHNILEKLSNGQNNRMKNPLFDIKIISYSMVRRARDFFVSALFLWLPSSSCLCQGTDTWILDIVSLTAWLTKQSKKESPGKWSQTKSCQLSKLSSAISLVIYGQGNLHYLDLFWIVAKSAISRIAEH